MFAVIFTQLSKRDDSSFGYDITVVVVLIELGKLIAALALCFKLYDVNMETLVATLTSENGRTTAALYLIPAGLYVLYNNLTFINMLSFDAVTYTVLSQCRIILTGIVFQIFFKRKLTRMQWFSLFLLTVGCVVKDVGATASKRSADGVGDQEALMGYLWGAIQAALRPELAVLLLQQVASSCAGVYNEVLLKQRSCDIPLMMQNVYMCFNSILFNLVALGVMGKLGSLPSLIVEVASQPVVMLVVACGTCYGLIASVLLKELNSILKTYAAAVEIFLCGIASHLILGTVIDDAGGNDQEQQQQSYDNKRSLLFPSGLKTEC
ncbi:unnamed protein product [Notodromas monacha]|uniref:Uncharacterized protein n=1 Tax=Notodromas monacha TaxID=399045 RepID=A0A7R9BKE7_9CRUS|nr:unnamed protein product [Notodromas monacha]CAG0916014.1 unnamed protein product [Notodromas monacha]